jgi:hypothetical protein
LYDFGIKALTHQKKTPPHLENAQNTPKNNKKVRQNPKKAKKLSSDALKIVFQA